MDPLPNEPFFKRIAHLLGPALGLVIFFAALWVLRQQLHNYRYHDVVRAFAAQGTRDISLAVAFTLISYLMLITLDLLGFRYIRRPLSFVKIALVGFVSHAFSNNMGVWLLGGAPLRLRLFSAWGLSALDAAKVTAFGSIGFALGLFAVSGGVFLWQPLDIPDLLHVPFETVHPLGEAFLLIVAGYLALTLIRRKPLKIRGWEFELPTPGLGLLQVVLSSVDWVVAGLVLYSLLAADVGLHFGPFLAIFVFAHIAGVVSQVPGGLGVFETVIVLFFSEKVPVADLLASLVTYRAIYYLFPLGLATALLGVYEVAQRRAGLSRLLKFFGKWAPGIVPQLLAFTTAVGGAILLFSGATPAHSSRLAVINDFLPLPVIEISHFLGSLVGACLLFLAQGLWRRLDGAYVMSVALLSAGIVLSLLKGGDYEEAIALAIMLAVLIPCRAEFRRKALLLHQTLSVGWALAIVTIISASVWLGIFSYRHKLDYAGDLWWQFTLSGDAPRFLRATVGVAAVVIFVVLGRLFRPALPRPRIANREEINKIKPLVAACPRTYANYALLGDKAFLYNETRTAFIMYGVEGRSWVSMGDPVGPPDQGAELAWSFRELCDRYAGWPVFYDIESDYLSTYLDLGLTLAKIGEEAYVPLENFKLEGNTFKNLRHSHDHAVKAGCTFDVIPPDRVRAAIPELQIVSDAWLRDKNTREKTFSLGYFDTDYLSNFPIAVVRHEGRIVGFANLWLGGGKRELSLDLMRFLSDAPDNVMDFLFTEMMLWGRREGYQRFDMGQAPLAGMANRDFAPLWNRLGALIYRHGEHFYNFQGIRNFKQKFNPHWEPRYIAFPGGMKLPRILTNLLAINSGGIAGAFRK
jgi:phosphatidylglycerol lysyltransferase